MKFNNKKISHVLLTLAFIVLLIGLSLNSINSNFLFTAAFVTIILCGVAIIPLWNKVEPRKDIEGKKIAPFFVTVTSALYAIIGGFAITEALKHAFLGFGAELEFTSLIISFETLIPVYSELVRLKSQFLIVLVFLVIAIPFYHGAMMYLVRTRELMASESKKGQLFHFGFLFTQAIIFLGIGISLGSLPTLIFLISFLMVIDSIWILVGKWTNNPPPFGWLCLNLGFFASIILINFPYWPFGPLEMLLIFAISRTIIDYVGFEEIYFK